MTAFGLAVAIPAVLGYNALQRGNKDVLNRMHRFAHQLHAYFLTGAAPKSSKVVVPLKEAK
jgi:biopolymer transport protein ExbB